MKSPCKAAVLLLALIPGLSHALPVATASGAVEGVAGDGLLVYRGIPYAAAPVGALRWREPQPAPSWTGTYRADHFAPACVQTGVSMPGETPPPLNEDCLYLNLWKPAHAPRPLPVLVWIHGGGYGNGYAAMPLYWGARLARQGIIVVTVAYRLGPLGFLAHPELSRESGHASSGNYGLMDRIAALQWVRNNIAAFGGDPRRVTIAGQSAGAMAVSALMSSPRAAGLFQGAIAESGGLFEPLALAPRYRLDQAERDGEKYFAALDVSALAQARALPAEKLLGEAGMAVTHPVIEPWVLPASPYDIFAAGRQNDVPLLLGSNAEEARALVDTSRVTAAGFEAELVRSFGPLPPQLAAAYPHASDAEARQARLDLERDLRFGWDMWAWARLQARSGRRPVYYYLFRQRPPFPAGSVYQDWGASHFAELWYVFQHLDQSPWRWTAADRRLARQIGGYWSNFVKRGDPNAPGLPRWPAYTGGDDGVQQLGDPVRSGAVLNLHGLQTFDAAYTQVREGAAP
jgi:para-nitrobenzyl esterase